MSTPVCETFFSRKGAKKPLRNAVALCVFAPLRESSSLKERYSSGKAHYTITRVNGSFWLPGTRRSLLLRDFQTERGYAELYHHS